MLRGAPLRIVAAAEAPPRMISRAGPGEYETVTDVLLDDRDRALAAAPERAAKAAPGLLIDTGQLTGDPADAVTDSGAGALILVLGSRGAGAFTALLLGSVSRYAASHASVPVVVIRDETTPGHGLAGVGVGDLEHSTPALTFAFEEASVRKASLTAIHAWHRPQAGISRAGEVVAPPRAEAVRADANRHFAGLLDEWKAKYPDVAVSQEVVHGHPGRALVGLSARTDLVVIGQAHQAPRAAGPRLGPARGARPRAWPHRRRLVLTPRPVTS